MVVFTDRFSKMAYFCPTKYKGLTAADVADLYVQHVFRIQGVPSVLLHVCILGADVRAVGYEAHILGKLSP